MILQAFKMRPFVEHSETFGVALSEVILRLRLVTTLVTYQVLV